jgi:ferritin-like metal-binding protein YciE
MKKGVSMAKLGNPHELFVFELGAALTMEQTVLEMLRMLEQRASDDRLAEQFSHHRDETDGQIRNLEQIFSALGEQPRNQPCQAIDGLRREGDELMALASDEVLDAVLVGGAAKTEHHEIAVYDGLIAKAEAMGEEDVVSLLQENLEQEEHTLGEVTKLGERLTQQLVEQAA